MSLLSLQREFRAVLLDDARPAAADFGADSAAGYRVYHHAYRAQLVAALRDSYERLCAWLGDSAFEDAARFHVAGHPPGSWTLNDYGAEFADTLSHLYPDDPEVAEIAALDWAMRRAFDGADAPALDRSTLADVDWDHARLHFVPTLRFVPVTTNGAAIWTAIGEGSPVPAVQLLPEPASIRVWRAGLEPRFKTIALAERRALDLCLSGRSFARVCNELAAEQGVGGAVEAAGAYLGDWLGDGLLVAIA